MDFSIQGQNCYVAYRGSFNGISYYIVGTRCSPENPVAVNLKGADSDVLRFEAVKKGLVQILAGGTHY